MYKFRNCFAKQFMDADQGGAESGVGAGGAEPQVQAPIVVPDVEKTFTQSEVNDIVEKRLARERKKYEEESKKTYEEATSEAEKLSKMTAQEKREYELNKKIEEYEKREKELNQRALQSETKSILSDLGYSNDQINQLNNFLNYEDADSCKKSIESIDKLIKNIVADKVQAELNAKLKTVTKPQVSTSNNGAITWQQVLENPKLMADYKKQQRKK